MAKYIDQKEYLKKYLSGDKKAKKKKRIKNPKVKIIDEEIDNCADLDINEELLFMGEDAPQIVGVIDDSHQDAQFGNSKWKAIGNKTVQPVSRSRHSPDLGDRRMKSLREDKSPKRNRSVDLSPKRNYKNTDKSSAQKSTHVDKKKDYHNFPSERKERRNSDQSPKRRSHTSGIRSSTHKYYSEHSNDKSNDEHRDENRNENRDKDNSPPRRFQKSREEFLHYKNPVKGSPTRITSSDRTHNDSSHNSRINDIGVLKRPVNRVNRPSRFSDYSPPRKIKVEAESPVKEIKEEFSRPNRKSSDQSPRRRLTTSDKTSSQHKKSTPNMDNSPNRRKHLNPFKENSSQKIEDTNHKMARTLDGKIAGLQDAKTLKAESVMLRAKEDLQFAKLSKTVSGCDAEVQVRKNRAYKNRRLDEIDEQEERQKDKREQQKKEIYSRWGKGLKQIEVSENKIANETHEGAKPLARYSDDEDLDKMLRQQERDGDPMLEYLRRKEKEKHIRKDNEMEIPKFQGSYPENRFNIRPGYRWDRLDRSNGYEKKWFDVQNQKKAMQEEAYKYSTEDL